MFHNLLQLVLVQQVIVTLLFVVSRATHLMERHYVASRRDLQKQARSVDLKHRI